MNHVGGCLFSKLKIVKVFFVKIKATFISVSKKLGHFSKFRDYPISFDMEFSLPCC